jgi:lauroyl/myristoyl acyltransferase
LSETSPRGRVGPVLLDLYRLLVFGVARLAPRLWAYWLWPAFPKFAAAVHYRLAGKRRAAVARQLSGWLGPETGEDEISRIVRASFTSRWMHGELHHLATLGSSGSVRRSACAEVEIEGLPHLAAAVARGRGVVLWDCFFGKPLLAKAVLREKGFRLVQVRHRYHATSRTWLGRTLVRRANRAFDRALFAGVIEVWGGSIAPVRQIKRAVARGQVVCINALGNTGVRHVEIEHFGAKRQISPGAVSISRVLGAPLVPVFCFTQDDGRDRIFIEEPIQIDPDLERPAAAAAAAAHFVALLEEHARRRPEQWYGWLKS